MMKGKELALPLLSCVTWSKLLDLSEFQCPHLKNAELSMSFRYDMKIKLSKSNQI